MGEKMATRVTFVSCVKTKSATPELAEYLYISPWFRMAREWARRNSERRFILSAEYGLIEPGTLVKPYERTLNRMSTADRLAWSKRVIGQIDERRLEGTWAHVLAGESYRRFLMEALEVRFDWVTVPMEGLMMGQQLSWLKSDLGG
ncbi:hypothetical protein M2222_001374 [Bradyrhizobium elkanii]|uniref:DUF6884 domain-containing protein n=1 Tax=Bradyrhizobium elkanii TaxID=29448 RepID=UPI002167F974|nr:DUF6884 domain-containing protein [Bradyrhizobium elkanii]MCS3449805.1 hypothetical protein [Bradyrhizobium elkanii]MCS3559052.1 hypothetical protein [Bradyrhizobium elkanii]MCW2151102.1 hypothetical protein [Bradyrhizobium elkanii]MCW2374833.1 hypothetical protein [Bradyrhizobium elkanii]